MSAPAIRSMTPRTMKVPSVVCVGPSPHSRPSVSCRAERSASRYRIGERIVASTAPILASLPAIASDFDDEDLDLLLDTPQQGGGDWIVTILFSGAALALTVVTLGVAYLSFSSWLDKRQEQQDRGLNDEGKKREEYNAKMKKYVGKVKGGKAKKAPKEQEEDESEKKASSKGFGS